MKDKDYLKDIRDRNDDNSLKYDKMISEIPFITNPKELKKLKEIFIWNSYEKGMRFNMKIKILELLKNGISSVCAKYINDKNEIEYLPIFYIEGSQT